MKEHDEVQRLIRLKRYETPGEEYFQSFTQNLKERQRAEMLKSSSAALLIERLQTWFDETHGAKWLVPAGATAAVAAGLILNLPLSENANETVADSNAGPMEQRMLMQLPPSDEDIHLQLPQTKRVPGDSIRSFSGNGGVMVPAGATFREL